MPTKFNDPNGTAHQKTCENSCDQLHPETGATGRLDMNGNPFDVMWEKVGSEYKCKDGLTNCANLICPHIKNFFLTNP